MSRNRSCGRRSIRSVSSCFDASSSRASNFSRDRGHTSCCCCSRGGRTGLSLWLRLDQVRRLRFRRAYGSSRTPYSRFGLGLRYGFFDQHLLSSLQAKVTQAAQSSKVTANSIRAANLTRLLFLARDQVIHEMLNLATPWKRTNIEGRRRSWAIPNMQHHPLHTSTHIPMLRGPMSGIQTKCEIFGSHLTISSTHAIRWLTDKDKSRHATSMEVSGQNLSG